MVCVVRVDRPVADAVLERVRGQTSDLPLTIVRVPEPIEPDAEAAQARADVVARSYGARAVVWFVVAARGDITIFVTDPRARRLFVHRVDQGAGSPSAMLETSSLLVRDVLQSLLAGEPIGRPIEGPAVDEPEASPARDAPAPLDAPVVTRTPAAPKAPVEAVAREPHAAWTPFTAVGARAVVAHATPSAAVSHRLGLARGTFEGGAALTLGVTDVRRDSVGSLLIRRHTFGVFAGGRWQLGEQVTATFDDHAGVALFLRSTRPRVARLVASASQVNVHGYVGPEARIAWAPHRSWPRVAIGVGADFVFFPPAFSYEGPGGRDVRELALWPLQPYLSASLDFGPAW